MEKGRNPPEFKDPPVEDEVEIEMHGFAKESLRRSLSAKGRVSCNCPTRDRPCIAWYIHVHNLSREGFSGPSKIRASAVVSLPNMVAELLASAMKR